jgi:hypothetical protein
MKAQLKQYVDLLFAGTPDSDDMKQEILQNTLDRYDDLISQGKSPEAAYRLAISGIGDIHEMLDSTPSSPATIAEVIDPKKAAERKKMRAVAIGLYICCVIALGSIGDGILGVCLMFIMIASATVLMIMSRDEKEVAVKKTTTTLDKTLNTVTLAVFLVLSFVTGAWYITWLIWPIMGAVKGIIRACRDLRGGREG